MRAEIQYSSDRSLVVRFGDRICAEARERVRRLLWLLRAEPVAAVRNLNPAYCTDLRQSGARRFRVCRSRRATPGQRSAVELDLHKKSRSWSRTVACERP